MLQNQKIAFAFAGIAIAVFVLGNAFACSYGSDLFCPAKFMVLAVLLLCAAKFFYGQGNGKEKNKKPVFAS